MLIEAAITAAIGGFTYIAAHQFADHVIGQNDHEAANKALPGRAGWSALLSHVFKYHVVVLIMLLIVIAVFDLPVTLLGISCSILFSAVSHAFLDRRWPVRYILKKVGSPKFAEMTQPLHGMYLGDQGSHYLCLWISALLLALL